MSIELNDSLDDLLNAPMGEVRTAFRAPADFKPRDWTEKCGKCGGSGSWRGRGHCFACKGVGSFTFKTSPEARAKARTGAANRKASKAAETVDAFKATHCAVYEWLVVNSGRGFEFAVSLMGALQRFGSLTDGQLAAVERLIAREVEKAKAREDREANAPAADTAGIDRLKLAFDTAKARATEKGQGIRSLRITIGNMTISPASATSANPGALYVKASGEYLGKIAAGRFFAARECGAEQSAKVLAFVADPKAAAIAYGQETGVCCICNATLTNAESREAGIGPICAEKFGW